MKQRKTLTLSEHFYEAVKEMEDSTRHQVTDAVLDLFFNKKQISYDGYNDTVKLALACLMPELRKIQQKFDAGTTSKKFTAISKGGFCPNDGSELKRNEAERSGTSSSFLNSNIYNNIYNNHIISNQENEKNKTTPNTQNLAETQAEDSEEKRRFFADCLQDQLEIVKELDVAVFEKMSEVVNEVARATLPFKIRDEFVMPEQVLEKYLDFFRTTDSQSIVNKLSECICRVDTVRTTNRKNYLIATLYIEAKNNL